MMMGTIVKEKHMRFKTIGIIAVIVAIVLSFWPPGLMNDFLYQSIYGWRYPKESQCEDAVAIDYGPGESRMRYVVQLGSVELKQSVVESLTLCALPEEKLFFGMSFELAENRKVDIEREAAKSVVIAVRLYDETNNIVFEDSGSMGEDWYWTLYRRGNVAFVYGDTAFMPDKDARYKLDFKVLSKEKHDDFRVNIGLVGGGWK
jgi:hypothetical protein